MKKVLLLSLLLANLSFAITMINPKIDSRNNSKTYISIRRNQNQSKSGEIYIKGGYKIQDTKKCYQELNIPYDEKKVKFTIVDNQNIKINDKTIKIDKCLVKK